MNKILPEFLQGKISKTVDHPWKDYFQETLKRVHYFVGGVHAAVLLLYAITIIMLSVGFQSWRPARSAVYRMMITHLIPVLLLWRLVHYVSVSDWGIQIKSGNFCRAPFFNLSSQKPSAIASSTAMSTMTTTASAGTTTMPTRYDILVGTRYDATYLGAYDRWLDFHPGNRKFHQQLQHCRNMPLALHEKCLDQILSTRNARILLQDWRTGDWMHHYNPRQYVQDELKLLHNPTLQSFVKNINMLVAKHRFDVKHTTLAQIMVDQLETYKSQLLRDDDTAAALSKSTLPKSDSMTQQRRALRESSIATDTPLFTMLSKLRKQRQMLIKSSLPQHRSTTRTTTHQAVTIPSHARWSTTPTPRFAKGDLIFAKTGNMEDFFPGIIYFVYEEDGYVDIAYEDGEWAYEIDPARGIVYKDLPLEEGMLVKFKRLEDDDETDVVTAEVTRVHPNGRADLHVLAEGMKYRYVKATKLIRLEAL